MKQNAKTWWMVFNPYPEGEKPTCRHESYVEAVAEAGRLCAKTGKKIHVLKLVGTMHPQIDVRWEDRT
jgi:hypothetical protein